MLQLVFWYLPIMHHFDSVKDNWKSNVMTKHHYHLRQNPCVFIINQHMGDITARIPRPRKRNVSLPSENLIMIDDPMIRILWSMMEIISKMSCIIHHNMHRYRYSLFSNQSSILVTLNTKYDIGFFVRPCMLSKNNSTADMTLHRTHTHNILVYSL